MMLLEEDYNLSRNQLFIRRKDSKPSELTYELWIYQESIMKIMYRNDIDSTKNWKRIN